LLKHESESDLINILVRINKKHGVLIGIALVLLFTGIALATSTNLSASSSDVVIYAFDQNPAGSDKGNEWFCYSLLSKA